MKLTPGLLAFLFLYAGLYSAYGTESAYYPAFPMTARLKRRRHVPVDRRGPGRRATLLHT